MKQSTEPDKPVNRLVVMAALIIAGEAVFMLPFMIPRIFRGTVLDVFQISNFELGLAFSAYGFVAMISYFVGGPLADRFSARKLMALSLFSTAAAGVVYAGIPSLSTLKVLYGFWGGTSILLFWAALIRATREWGGAGKQGQAFGILDGGRGLIAALMASATVALLSFLLPVDPAEATLEQRTAALAQVIWVVAGLTCVSALLVLVFVPDSAAVITQGTAKVSGPPPRPKLTLRGVLAVIRLPAVWLQAVIILCAYVGFKSIDNVTLLARDVYNYDDVEAGQLGALAFWVRPFGAIGAGFLADRMRASRVTLAAFCLLIAGNLVFALGVIPPGMLWMLAMTLVVSCLGMNGLRGIYFALFKEARVPLSVTGSAAGVVSTIGYTPDVFFGPLMGYLTDSAPGAEGHQNLYWVVTGFAVVGLLATVLFRLVTREPEPGAS